MAPNPTTLSPTAWRVLEALREGQGGHWRQVCAICGNAEFEAVVTPLYKLGLCEWADANTLRITAAGRAALEERGEG